MRLNGQNMNQFAEQEFVDALVSLSAYPEPTCNSSKEGENRSERFYFLSGWDRLVSRFRTTRTNCDGSFFEAISNY
jgi:hypothetical protein